MIVRAWHKLKLSEWFMLAVIIIIVIYVFYTYKNPINILINKASAATQFNTTYFLVYDKSTSNVCNRLVIIKPFNWYLVCLNNQLYLLESESGYDCEIGYSPAIRITANNNLSVYCTSLDVSKLLTVFTTTAPIKINYNLLGKTRFTVLSALNLLFDLEIFPLLNEKNTIQNALNGTGYSMLNFENDVAKIASKNIIEDAINRSIMSINKDKLESNIEQYYQKKYGKTYKTDTKLI